MPYIKADTDRRKKLQDGDVAQNAGELNYQIFYYVKHHYENNSLYSRDEGPIKLFVDQFLGTNPNYQKYNDMTGALVRCDREIFRRLPVNTSLILSILDSYNDQIVQYEKLKIQENGDVE